MPNLCPPIFGYEHVHKVYIDKVMNPCVLYMKKEDIGFWKLDFTSVVLKRVSLERLLFYSEGTMSLLYGAVKEHCLIERNNTMIQKPVFIF